MRAAALLAALFQLDLRSLLRKPRVRQALAALEARRGRRNASPAMANGFMGNEVSVWAAGAVGKPGKPMRRADWEKFWASGTGKSWKALKDFPKRIRKMATCLKTLLCSAQFGQKDARQFWDLPPSLGDYADWMESRIKTMPFFVDRAERRARPQWVVHLSRRVKALTGHFCDKEVAELLNAVHVALNGERDPDIGFDAQTIADFRFRRKRKAHRT